MRSISRCLNKQLVDLCQRSVQLEELANKIKLMLPDALANECQVGSFNKGCLLLTTTDAAWATQLRYAIPELRDKLRKEAGMYQLSSIKVVVIEPTLQYAKSVLTSKHELSEKAKAIIISESQHCTYEPLQKALLHLADGDNSVNVSSNNQKP
ncbi:DUF721 domain-containing protein [Fluoribacter gormanii]|uniref:Zn-ribbon-containing, possibly RNA-binding protein and truncated derivatives n=1 Tax=Fluoribacter gormanii TaxID=464 RepID=A0A377GLZ2_9GAMM|nr:DUF721 domain-containing protein [Fluoribacter gormanii]KTD05616.1 hypothetical protein Lgor_0101 [Fluoribacter gormanii]MCW8471090.1 DUF721 domain-containing protein [Fluoribacter gormanii]SIQ67045.1 Protein of unknown function [Fluoribacter gormanii]STO25791.1 Zn-ribbon-containing, possibly RNA-binding protein and truncated derivatives [Fluoribacter gormanii]